MSLENSFEPAFVGQSEGTGRAGGSPVEELATVPDYERIDVAPLRHKRGPE